MVGMILMLVLRRVLVRFGLGYFTWGEVPSGKILHKNRKVTEFLYKLKNEHV